MIESFSGLGQQQAEFLRQLFRTRQLKIQTIHRRGPRFFVASVTTVNHTTAIVKMCLFPTTQRDFVSEKFQREIDFLTYVQRQADTELAASLPKILGSGKTPYLWYVREHITGSTYDINGSNVLFRPRFFTKPVLGHLKKLFTALHSLRPAHLPRSLALPRVRHDTIIHLLAELDQNKAALVKKMGPTRYQQMVQVLTDVQPVFDAAPLSLNHFEPYPVHFFFSHHRLRMIDWENIYWTTPVRDWGLVWLRAFGHPAWQKNLVAAAKKDVQRMVGKNFPLLWNTDLLRTAVLSLLGTARPASQRGMHQLQQHALRTIDSILTLNEAIYERPLLRS